ncbi:hypothetical protein GCHA_0096 [Paraglaciecola chathamensis S18K6]|uniref:Uncharacterized protein n=2 Tax=Paraglaciecola chathamensis TaxID=368405 RepID=A0ABQ0I4T4_9ALTE|nr:hypothetical protein GAGA_1460 [Paraglaciecola agarilytica NO2]GAC08062.1 hypothetical protein GCHA_0096 [Paraglaciecola chathamensis S18K6]
MPERIKKRVCRTDSPEYRKAEPFNKVRLFIFTNEKEG